MPPKSGRRRAAAARAKPAAASLDCEQQHEQHSLADDGAKESAAAALARECPALRRLIDSHLARIDAEGTFGGSVAAPERVLQSQTVQKDGEKGGDESETVSWRRRRARIALSRRFGRPRPSLSHSNSKNKTKTPTVDRRMHTILIPLGEHQDEQLYHAMKAQVARIPEQVCFLLSSLSSSTFFLFAPEKKLMFLSVSLSLARPQTQKTRRCVRCPSTSSWSNTAETWQRHGRRPGEWSRLPLLLPRRRNPKRPRQQPPSPPLPPPLARHCPLTSAPPPRRRSQRPPPTRRLESVS